MTDMVKKLIIGSANFGMEYGIANKKKLNKEEVFDILELAHTKGIQSIDTARAYGDAENAIGGYFAQKGKIFKVITKLPAKNYTSADDVKRDIYESMKSMNVDYIDIVLMHSYKTYEDHGSVIVPVLKALCKEGLIGNYGASVYHPDEAMKLVKDINDEIVIEFPLNLFDRRFINNGLIERLKSAGVRLFARSVFLQGLFFMEENALEGNLKKAAHKNRLLHELSDEYSIRTEHIALLFVLANPLIDGVVIGVDSRDHLLSDLTCTGEEVSAGFELVSPHLHKLQIDDEDIILPYRWGMN